MTLDYLTLKDAHEVIYDSDGDIDTQDLSDSFPEPHGHSSFSVCLSAPHAACMKYKNIFKNKIIYNDDSS